MNNEEVRLKEAKQRLNAFMIQFKLSSCDWDGQMLVCKTKDSMTLSSMDLQDGQIMRPMWLHLEEWLRQYAVTSIHI